MIHYITLIWILSSYDNNVHLEGWHCQIPITHTANPLSLMVNMALSVCTYWFTHSYDVCACMLLSLTLNPCLLMLHHCPSVSHGWWLCIIWEVNIHLKQRLRCNLAVVHFTPFRFRFTEGGTFRFNCVLSVVKDFSDFFSGQQVASGPVLL